MQLCDGSLATGVKAIGCGYNHSLVVLAINSEVGRFVTYLFVVTLYVHTPHPHRPAFSNHPPPHPSHPIEPNTESTPPITAYCLLLQVWSTGLNNYGQLGLGDLENRRLLQHVAALDDRAITEVGRCSRSVVRMNGRRAITEVGLVVLCG